MAFAESWHVRSRSRECAATARAFVDGETIVTALYPDPESSGYLRRDFCLDAWKDLPEETHAPFSFWKTTYAAPSGKDQSEAEEKLSAEEILHRLIEEDEDHTENTRYILAVMLERQKLLRETDNQRTPNGILRVYEHRKTGEVFLIRDPDIPLAEVESVQNEVIVLLENNGRLPDPLKDAADLTDSGIPAGLETPAGGDPSLPQDQIGDDHAVIAATGGDDTAAHGSEMAGHVEEVDAEDGKTPVVGVSPPGSGNSEGVNEIAGELAVDDV
jgi:hypothetical protein